MYCWGQYLGYLFVSSAVTLDSPETPFAKTSFSRFLSKQKIAVNKKNNPNIWELEGCRQFLVVNFGGELFGGLVLKEQAAKFVEKIR